MKTIHLAGPVRLTLDDGAKVQLRAGVQEVEDHIAEHWYVKSHCKADPSVGRKTIEPNAHAKAILAAEAARLDKVEAKRKADEEAAEAERVAAAQAQAAAEAAQAQADADAAKKKADEEAADLAKAGEAAKSTPKSTRGKQS